MRRKKLLILIPEVVYAWHLRWGPNCEALTESIEKIKDTEVIHSTVEYEFGNDKTQEQIKDMKSK